MNYVQPLWEIFSALAIPPNAPSDQIHAMKTAYFAGASSLFAVLIEKLDSAPNNKDGGKFLIEVENELIGFMDASISELNSN